MDLIDPKDSLEKQNEKLRRITQSLMRRVEQTPDQTGLAYAQFERAALLEEQVRQRTVDLERALDLLHQSNARLASANKEAREARENLAQAIETVDEGFAMFDDDERLVMFNSRFCKGLPDVRKALGEGTSFEEYVHLISESGHLTGYDDPQSRKSWRSKRMRLHRKEHAVFNIRLSENRWIQVSEHRTETRGTVVLQTDVSEIMRLERQERAKLIEEQAVMLQGTLDHLNQGVCIFDAQGHLVGWNRQMTEILQRSLTEEARGLPFAQLIARVSSSFDFSGDLGREDIETWAAISAGREPLRFEATRYDGAILDVFAQEMPDTGFVVSLTDVTLERHTSNALRELNETLERRVAQRTTALGEALEAARRANSSKDRFVAAASHDLLQPLSAAKLYVSSLEDRGADELGKDIARKAISALSNAEALIDALMDISKLDLGLAHYEMTPVSIDAILGSLITEFAPVAADRNVSLKAIPTSCTVISDKVYLRRILQNLIANALRYTTGRKVVVGARRRQNSIRIDVVDQGPGISTTDQKLIFQEFKQLPGNATNGEGLGLGLAIVERACKMLGHTLELNSRPGFGSRFSVTLPASDLDAVMQHDNRSDGSTLSPALQSHVVGLIENDPDLAHSITTIIEAFGSDVIHASSGEEALDLIEELGFIPDGWLIDFQLGTGMDGVEVAEILRTRYCADPLQIISADRSPELRRRCHDLAIPLCRKPITREDLHAFLASLSIDH